MTSESIALLKYAGRPLLSLNLGMLPRANYLFVLMPQEAPPPTKQMLPAKGLVALLRDGGIPVACLADILKVERKTIYAWLDGADPREGNASRIETLYGLLGGGRVDLRSLHRVWNRRLEHGHTVRDLLSADDVSIRAVEDALEMLGPSLRWHSDRGGRKDTPRDGWSIPLLDEIPTAGSRD
jgi:hypothetical protein